MSNSLTDADIDRIRLILQEELRETVDLARQLSQTVYGPPPKSDTGLVKDVKDLQREQTKFKIQVAKIAGGITVAGVLVIEFIKRTFLGER